MFVCIVSLLDIHSTSPATFLFAFQVFSLSISHLFNLSSKADSAFTTTMSIGFDHKLGRASNWTNAKPRTPSTAFPLFIALEETEPRGSIAKYQTLTCMKAYEKHSIGEVRLANYIFEYKYWTTSKSLPTTTAALSNSLPPAATKNTPIPGLFGQKSNSQSGKNVSNPSGLFGRASVTATTSTSSSAPSSFIFGGTGTTLSDNKSASSGGGLGYIAPSIFGSLFSTNSTSQTQLGEQNTNRSGSMFDTTPLLTNATIESRDHQDTPRKYQRPKRTPVVDAKDLEINHVKVVADHFSSSDKAG